jgi:hypothetical protein
MARNALGGGMSMFVKSMPLKNACAFLYASTGRHIGLSSISASKSYASAWRRVCGAGRTSALNDRAPNFREFHGRATERNLTEQHLVQSDTESPYIIGERMRRHKVELGRKVAQRARM